ncbi:MAG: rubrerythrin family protein [Candidatus Omnitrophica bacterium]|nr:rubrerythrin family protein [Candidatus Omnitrophota bacterium]
MTGKKTVCKTLTGIVFFSLAFLAITALVNAEEATSPAAKTTLDNLMTAFNGESNAHTRYLAFAQKADEENYGKAASLFRAAARAEQVHFEHHAKVIRELGGMPEAKIETPVIKTTKENLEAALKGETYEKDIMYPEFLAQAKKENIKGAIDAFEDAGRAEAVHAELYRKALDNLEAWKGSKKDLSVCPVCGNVVEVITFAKCPICDTEAAKFMTVG